MQKIYWNKVTWYSKLLALFLFFCVWLLGVYIGSEFKKFTNYKTPLLAKDTAKQSTDIAVGKPCDIHMFPPYVADSPITNTHGLQCIAYGDSFPGPKEQGDLWNRNAIWMQPNSLPTLNFYGRAFGSEASKKHQAYEQSLDFLVKNWVTYRTSDKKLNFKYPSDQWQVISDTDHSFNESNQPVITLSIEPTLTTENHEAEFTPFVVEYFPNQKFEAGPNGPSSILNNFPEGTTALNDQLQFFEQFEINNNQIYAFTQLPVIDLGDEDIFTIFYIVGQNGYARFTYNRDSNLEAFIRNIHVE